MSWRARGMALGLICAVITFSQAFAADISAVTAAPPPVNSDGLEPYVAPPPPETFRLINEARVGVFAHNWIHDEGAPVDVSIELLSSPIRLWNTTNPWISWFFNPRLNIGGMINTEGKSSYAFTGVTWRIPIYGKFFFEGEFGGAINDAPLHPEWNRVDMGCRLTFRESGGFGYQFTDNIVLIGSIEHVSHATFCTKINPGLTQVGARVGYKF